MDIKRYAIGTSTPNGARSFRTGVGAPLALSHSRQMRRSGRRSLHACHPCRISSTMKASRFPWRAVRSLALAAFALAMLVRIGPLCEPAVGATPAAMMAMSVGDCPDAPVPASSQDHQATMSCATGCPVLPVGLGSALVAEAGASVKVRIPDAIQLFGITGGPSPPPPRS